MVWRPVNAKWSGNFPRSFSFQTCMTIRVALLALLATAQGLACSCSYKAQAHACELTNRTEIVFLGTVVAAQPDPVIPERTNLRVYRVRVDRAFKGLPLRRCQTRKGDSVSSVSPPENTCSGMTSVAAFRVTIPQCRRRGIPEWRSNTAAKCSTWDRTISLPVFNCASFRRTGRAPST